MGNIQTTSVRHSSDTTPSKPKKRTKRTKYSVYPLDQERDIALGFVPQDKKGIGIRNALTGAFRYNSNTSNLQNDDIKLLLTVLGVIVNNLPQSKEKSKILDIIKSKLS